METEIESMAQTFLIKAATKDKKGTAFRVVKDRAWDDMPWSFLVQKQVVNYKLGQNRLSWVYVDKFENEFDAVKKFEKRVGK